MPQGARASRRRGRQGRPGGGVVEVEDAALSTSVSESVAAGTVTSNGSGTTQASGQRQCLRVAMVCDFFYPNSGGVENHIYAVAACLCQLGHHVCIVTHAYGDRSGVRWIEPGIKVFYLPILAVYNQASLPTGVVSLPLLRSVFLRESVDLVHAHAAVSSLGNEALVTAGILGIRTVFTDHSLFGFADVSAILTNKILRFNLVNVTHVICVSHTARENTVLRSGVPPDRVAVIPNAIDPCSFQPDADDPPVDTTTGRVVIVIVSRLVYRKGVDLLVRAIPIVCARFPAVDFVIGGDGPKRVDIEEMRERRNLQDRVRMLGAVPHTGVRDVMCSGDIFLNASLTEAFCIAIVEAASCGMLVVSTAVGGVPEVLPPDIVTLADPTVDGITAAVAIAIARATTRTAAEKRHQHDRVARMYDWRVVALRTQKVYTAALKSPLLRLDQRLGRVYTVGPIAGPILVCYCVVLELLALLLTWLVPVEPRSPLWFTRQDRRGLGTRGAHRGASTRD